jgi:hypothetical protein
VKASEVLERAGRLLEEREWLQGVYGAGPNGEIADENAPDCPGFCLMGALKNVLGGWKGTADAEHFIDEVIRDIHGAEHWNDTPGRTKQEVLEALSKAAELARKEGR